MRALIIHNRKYSTTIPRLARILASDSIQGICGEVFRSRGHELIEKPGISKEDLLKCIHEYDGLVVRSGTKVTKEVINAGVNLKLIGRAGTGVDNIDTQHATSKGILVVNTPGGNTVSTAELAVSHILALARNIPQATAALKAGRWDRSLYTGSELSGKTLGIIGMGRIGKDVAQRCQGFGMVTIGYDPVLSEASSRKVDVEPVQLEDIFARSDFITIHTPLTKETRYLINRATLSRCKPGVRIVNCARGGIVNEEDLLEAIKSGHVAGASLDTLEVEPPVDASHELRMHPNVIMTPHLGASTTDAQLRVARQVAENMTSILDGGDYKGVVNAPDLSAIHKVTGAKPYVLLCERIGSIHGQLLGTNKVNNIQINLSGKDIADSRIVDVMKSAVLKGVLGVLGDETVSYVSAMATADELGLQVSVNSSDQRSPSDSGLANVVTVEIEVEGTLNMTRTVRGTVFGQKDIRITEIDGYPVSIPTEGNILLFNNKDSPGVLRRIAEKVALAGINIANFSLGRKDSSKYALGALVTDSTIPSAIVDEMQSCKIVTNAVQWESQKDLDPIFRVSNSANLTGINARGITKPSVRPRSPEFSSGPCKKRPGYSVASLRTDVLGRSHRSSIGKNRLKKAIEDTKRILGLPSDYLCGIVPASDTGAFEMAMWNMLGARPVDACYWESFGKGWREDAVKHLKLPEVNDFKADYGYLPNLADTNPDHDILFTYNGTTSGVRVPDLDWISDDRTGLTFNDCTSAAFAMDIDWTKTDVSTFSWQKVLGGEGAHGMLILSPRAVERIESFDHGRPLPKIFRMAKTEKDGSVRVNKAIFKGDTINTPSMLCVEDYIDAMEWSENIGGLHGLIDKSKRNLAVIQRFVAVNEWISFLAHDPSTLSNTSVCLTLDLNKEQVKNFVALLQTEMVAFDIGAYRDAPDGLRIWCGATVEESDLEALMPWLKWAYESVKDGATE